MKKEPQSHSAPPALTSPQPTPTWHPSASVGLALLCMASSCSAITLSLAAFSKDGIGTSSLVGDDARNHTGVGRSRAGNSSRKGLALRYEDDATDPFEAGSGNGGEHNLPTEDAFTDHRGTPSSGGLAESGPLKFVLNNREAGSGSKHYLSMNLFGPVASGTNDFTAWSPAETVAERPGIRAHPVGRTSAGVPGTDMPAFVPKSVLARIAPSAIDDVFASGSGFKLASPFDAAPIANHIAFLTPQPLVIIPEPGVPALAAMGGLLFLMARSRPVRRDSANTLSS